MAALRVLGKAHASLGYVSQLGMRITTVYLLGLLEGLS
jgi:hypothetical protein